MVFFYPTLGVNLDFSGFELAEMDYKRVGDKWDFKENEYIEKESRDCVLSEKLNIPLNGRTSLSVPNGKYVFIVSSQLLVDFSLKSSIR